MKRLLKDAEKLSGVKYDISSFADISEAIHVMQQNMEISGYSVDALSEKLRNASLTQAEVSKVAESMGISYEEASRRMMDGSLTIQDANALLGTTAREAATTIEGSLNMMKGAWQNLVVGMADENANMDVLITNFVDSAALAAQNLLPRIEQTLVGIGQLITALAPVIAEALPQLVESVLPSLLTAGVSLVTALVNGVVTALPALYTALLEGMEIILVEVFGVSKEKAGEFAEGINSAFTAIKDGFFALVESAQTDGTWLNEIWTGLKDTGKAFADFCVALWDAISVAFAWCVDQINTEGTLLNTIWESIKSFISAAVQVIQSVIQAFAAILRGDWSAAWNSCLKIVTTIGDSIVSIALGIIDWIVGFLAKMVEAGYNFIKSFEGGMADKFAQFHSLVFEWVTDNIVTPILNMGTDLYEAGAKILSKFWDGLKSIWDKVKSWWDGQELSDKNAPSVNGGDGTGHATGLNYVPYDEYPAILHRGEAVLTAAEASVWRRDGLGGASVATAATAGGITINQYIQSVPQTPVDFANATEAYFEQARWTL